MKGHASREPLLLRNAEVRRGLKLVFKFSLRQGVSPGGRKMKKVFQVEGSALEKILHQGQVGE